MFGAIFSIIFIILVSGCATKGPDIIRPISLDSPDYPKSPGILSMPLTLMVLDVDGLKQATILTNTDPYEIHLAPGEHVIDFQYYKQWGTGEILEVVESEVMTLNIDVKAGQTYALNYEKPERKADAKKLVKGFDAWMIDPSSGIRKSAAMLGKVKSSIVTNIVRYDTSNSDVGEEVENAEPPVVTTTLATTPVSVDQTVSTSVDQTALSELKSKWKQASKEERQSFLNWVLIEKTE